VSARLFWTVGSSHLGPLGTSRSRVVRVARLRGETMRSTSLLECSGTVVVHRDQSVACTHDTCPRDLPRRTWFSLHSSFVRCSTALGGDGWRYCELDAPVTVGTGRWQPW
jgi:hypothetical protein